ncbi:MAG: GNAT family N-acetyltransferase [Caldimonas sp.]|uniref:GNAT family N-acetyltransferase n=1 Tax=Caldimonas sp. TaxID=2838790 RepID=UPI0039199FD0
MPVEVTHNPAAQRFEAALDGQLSVADYELRDGIMHMTHTGVPLALRGQGIAAQLVRAALDHARAHGFKVNPLCSYVRAYMQRHPETQALWAR